MKYEPVSFRSGRDAIDEHRLVLSSQPIRPLTDGRPSEELLLRLIARDGSLVLPGSFLRSPRSTA